MKTIAVTGATSGIGLAALRILGARGYRMIGIGRSGERIDTVLAELKASGAAPVPDFIRADLSSREEIRRAAGDIGDLLGETPLYCLVNNAGSFAGEYRESVDGVEWQLAVNAMAPYLMSRLLLPRMAEGSRIVTVGSSAHFGARLHWKDPMMRRRYSSLGAYRQSKFFTVLMTREFNRRFREKGIRSFIADPGLVNTDIGLKGTGGLARLVWGLRRRKGQSVEEGAATIVHLADEMTRLPEHEIYFKYCRPFAPDSRTADPDLCRRFSRLAQEICGI